MPRTRTDCSDPAISARPPACVDVGLAQLGVDLCRRHTLRLQAGGIEGNADFTADAAATIDGSHPFDAKQALCDRIVDVPTELFKRHVGRFSRIIGDRITGDVDPLDLWLKDAFRQVAANVCNRISDVIDSSVDRRADCELNECHRAALARARIDFVDAADAAHGSFDLLRYLCFKFARRRARLCNRDRCARKIDVGVVVDVHAHEADDARE